MKKFKYIVMAMLTVALAAVNTACMDNQNEWTVDPNANGNRTWGPVDLGVEKGDTCLKIFKFTATNATGYVAQVSTVTFDSAATTDIKEYTFGKVNSGDSVTLGGLEPKTEYYLRVKACCEGKEDSQWLQYCKDGVYTVKTAALASKSFTLTFDNYVGVSPLPSYFHDGAFTLYLTDTGGKMTVDSSSKEFNGKELKSRLKSGAKSSETNSMRIHCSNAGTLTIYPFGGSSKKDANLIVTQNGEELLNVEQVTNSGNTDLPAYNIDVKAGDVLITYPTNSVNFYGFEFAVADGETYVEDEVEEQGGGEASDGFEANLSFVGLQQTDIVTNGAWGTATVNDVDVPAISSTGGTELTAYVASQPNIILSYTNSNDKAGIFRFTPDYATFNGKGGIIRVTNLAVGQTIKVTFSSKNTSTATLTGSKGCSGSFNSTSTEDKQVATFTATAATVEMKETLVGMNIYSVEVTK